MALLVGFWTLLMFSVVYLSRNYNSCKNRVFLTYLVLALSVSTVLLQQRYIGHSLLSKTIKHPIILCVLSILLLLITLSATNNSSLKVSTFSLFILTVGLILHPLYKIAETQGLAAPILTTVIMVFTILSVLTFIQPNILPISVGHYLLFGLIALVIFRIALLFTRKTTNKWLMVSSVVGILIFTGFTIFDTKMMILRARKCHQPYDHINNAISLFLDFINLLSDSFMLSSVRR